MKRNLNEVEKLVVREVAARLPKKERDRLLGDLVGSLAEVEAPDGSRIVFHLLGYQRPPYRGQHSYGVTGDLIDRDGVQMSLDLHADENGRLLELELIRWGEGGIIEPNWATLRFHMDPIDQ